LFQVNHKFDDTNVDFDFITSPRFGATRCPRATKLIPKGEELFIDYNYNMKHDTTPQWYKTIQRERTQKKLLKIDTKLDS
jgi:hypothetical protein